MSYKKHTQHVKNANMSGKSAVQLTFWSGMTLQREFFVRKQNFRQFHRQALRAGVAALVAAGLGACALGPEFKTPAAPAPAGERYTPTPLAAQTAASRSEEHTSELQ